MRYTDKEMEEAEKNGTWPPPAYECLKCGTRLQSKYPGHFVECKCGSCFVDSTPHYSRLGGGELLVQLEEWTGE